PSVPRQQPGMSFAVKHSGLVGIATSQIATDDDIREIAGIRSVLHEAVSDLLTLTAGSNAYAQIDQIATRYKSALYDDHGNLVVDLLYAQGIRLQNAAVQLRRSAEGGDYPEMNSEIAEAL